MSFVEILNAFALGFFGTLYLLGLSFYVPYCIRHGWLSGESEARKIDEGYLR